MEVKDWYPPFSEGTTQRKAPKSELLGFVGVLLSILIKIAVEVIMVRHTVCCFEFFADAQFFLRL